jgi:hypothetical protein
MPGPDGLGPFYRVHFLISEFLYFAHIPYTNDPNFDENADQEANKK